ncbi:MAG: C1 family peptidase, partial [Candidatus Aminicenantes bacterium]|nr:C1 family peptidase [Candidatus Aminicenantes bacterium]
LDPASVRPVGREVESNILEPGVSVQAYAGDAEIAANLPVAVDNSKLKYFPGIRNQNPLGSCAAFSTTFTQLSYMTAFQRDLDITSPTDNTNKYSPKWTYNMVNGGTDSGSSFNSIYPLLEKHGAATWAEFPYDGNYRAWCLLQSAWRNALSVRSNPAQLVFQASSDTGLAYVKELLANGYVLIFGTYITSWQYKTILDDPATPDDTPELGKPIGYWLNGEEGSHAMTIVGYNDAIWTDVNSNGLVDAGEKGGFRIANSWGPAWGDGGFVWLAYDALKAVSAVPGGASAGRRQAFQSNIVWVLTARDSYSPLMIAEFTVNHAKRNQLKMTLGRSATSATTPTTTWTPSALQNQGANYAFDGTATAVDGGFVLDYSDILIEGAGALRYYLGMGDNFTGDVATLSAFKLVDLTTTPATETVYSAVPQTADNQQAYGYVDYVYTGPAYDHPPVLSNPQVNPALGTSSDTFGYLVYYNDQDGDAPSIKDVVIDGSAHAMTLMSGSASSGWYSYDTGLAVGSHDYHFSFRDSRGATARAPLAGTLSGPNVYAFLLSSISPPSATAGGPTFTLTVNGADFVNEAV